MAGAPAGRAAQRRRPGGRRGPTERRKIQPYQCDSGAGASNRHRHSGNHARPYRSAAGAGRRSDPADRHRRAAGDRAMWSSDRGRARASASTERRTFCSGLASRRTRPQHPRLILVHPQSGSAGRARSRRQGSLAVSSVTGRRHADLLERDRELARSLLPAEDAIALNRRQAAAPCRGRCGDALQAMRLRMIWLLVAEELACARGRRSIG